MPVTWTNIQKPRPFLQQNYRFSAGNAKAQINMVFTGESFYHSFPAYGIRHQVILYLFRSRFNDSSCYFLKIRRPDDWHIHFRDGAMLGTVVPFTSEFSGAPL